MESTHLDGKRLVLAVQGFIDRHEGEYCVQRLLLDLLEIVDRNLAVDSGYDEDWL